MPIAHAVTPATTRSRSRLNALDRARRRRDALEALRLAPAASLALSGVASHDDELREASAALVRIARELADLGPPPQDAEEFVVWRRAALTLSERRDRFDKQLRRAAQERIGTVGIESGPWSIWCSWTRGFVPTRSLPASLEPRSG